MPPEPSTADPKHPCCGQGTCPFSGLRSCRSSLLPTVGERVPRTPSSILPLRAFAGLVLAALRRPPALSSEVPVSETSPSSHLQDTLPPAGHMPLTADGWMCFFPVLIPVSLISLLSPSNTVALCRVLTAALDQCRGLLVLTGRVDTRREGLA